MSRRYKLILNSGTGLLKQVVTVVCGFIVPRYMLLAYGSEVNGLISSITYFLGMITLLEMGIGPVIQSNLYKPLAEKDSESISKIVKSSNKFFRTISVIFLIYLMALCFFYPIIINSSFGKLYTVSLLLIISVSTIAQYFFGITYQLLLNADQKAYVQQILNIITIVLNTILSIVIIKCGGSVHLVKLVSSVVFLIRPWVQYIYVQKKYTIIKSIEYDEEPIKQKWNGFSQHLASVVTNNIDVVLLTMLSTLQNVSIYYVYNMIATGVSQIVMTAATGLEATFGNMIAKGEYDSLNRAFLKVEWLTHFLVAVIFTIAAITICPFILVYTRGINDANYKAPLFGMLLVFAYGAQCLRIPYFRVIKAAGAFRETQNGAFISMMINVVVSLVLIKKYGLTGVAIGTFIAMMYHTMYFAFFLKDNIIFRKIGYFIKYLLIDAIIITVSFLLKDYIECSCGSYLSWILYAIKISMLTGVVAIITNIVFFCPALRRIKQ